VDGDVEEGLKNLVIKVFAAICWEAINATNQITEIPE
jgi:hypothetical protein